MFISMLYLCLYLRLHLEYDSLAKVIAKHPNRKETTKYVSAKTFL
jgi:hypothetical protein